MSSRQSVSDEGTSFAGRGSLRSQQPVFQRGGRLTTAHRSAGLSNEVEELLDALPEGCALRSASPVRDPDSHARLTEYNFIVRLQSNAARTSEDRNRSAPAYDLGSVFATIVAQSKVAGKRLVCDVGMLS
jgi:hypothetical protein